MKGKVVALLAGMLCMGSVAMADLSMEEGYLGGIEPGSDEDYVVQIYGTPKVLRPAEYQAAWGDYSKVIGYGDSVSMHCTGKSANGPFHVVMIHVSANNGFSTPRGIHVGSTRREVYQAYGAPYVNQGNGKHLWYKVNKKGNMVFHFKGDVVESINFGWNS